MDGDKKADDESSEPVGLAMHIKDLAMSFNDFPILLRLEYVATLLCQKQHDYVDEDPRDPALAVAEEILNGVIRVLKTVPHVAELTSPKF